MEARAVAREGQSPDPGRIRAKLDFLQLPYDQRVLSELCLEVLLDEQDYAMGEEELLKAVERSERGTVEEAKREDALAFSDQNALSIFRDVLTAAWKKGGDLNPHEAFVMQTLAERLGIAPHEHRLVEAQLGRFPTSDARPHSPRLVDEALKELQNRGLVVRYREGTETAYAIPEEVAIPLRAELLIELRGTAYRPAPPPDAVERDAPADSEAPRSIAVRLEGRDGGADPCRSAPAIRGTR